MRAAHHQADLCADQSGVFWFEGRNPDTYERYMRQIIEYTMAQGAVPILATKADNIEKDQSINLTTAKLAYEYDLPLWNWWAAAQPLGDHGIDPYRDGFHISVAAWNERSKTFSADARSPVEGVEGYTVIKSSQINATLRLRSGVAFFI